MAAASTESKLKQISNELEARLANDSGVPRNIRKGANDAVALLMDKQKDTDLKVSSAISILADLSNDSNIPMDSWSVIMQILSELEMVLKSLN
jgi:hypothetical protein